MKVTALLLCALGVVVASTNNNPNKKQADKQFLQKQQDILQLFYNVHQAFNNEKQQQQVNSFNFQQQAQNSNNPNAVKKFQNAYQQGLLQRNEVFNYNNPNHMQQAIQLFDMFYFAKDYDTFYQAAAWARSNVNEGQFMYACSVAVLNRPDTQCVALPPQAEVFPHMYVNAQAVQQAQNYKQQGQKKVSVQSNNTNNYYYNKQQQYQQQDQPTDYPFDNQNQNQYDQENRANQYQNHQNQNREGRVSYYNEDINLNQQFAYE